VKLSVSNMVLDHTDSFMTIFLCSGLPVDLDCIQCILSHAREKLASALTPSGQMVNMLHDTLVRLA
jgi:hypothetical protein